MTNLINGTAALTWITSFNDRFDSTQAYLTELDRLAGDGDFGANISSALNAPEQACRAPRRRPLPPCSRPQAVASIRRRHRADHFSGCGFIAKGQEPTAAALTDIAQGIAAGL